MKKILPFMSDPVLKAHQFHAFMAGMVLGEYTNERFEWLLSYSLRIMDSNNYFCVCYPGDCPVLLASLKGTKEDCFERGEWINTDFDCIGWEQEMIHMLQDNIQLGFYAYGMFNEYHIPCKTFYKKEDFIHDYLIIGFDADESCFYIAGYTSKGIFEVFPVSYENYITSIKINKDCLKVDFYRLKSNFLFQFNTSIARQSLKEFLDSTEHSKYFIDYCFYGKKALENMDKIMNLSFAQEYPFLYLRNVTSICEHGTFYANLILYLMNHSYITRNIVFDRVIDQLDDIEVIIKLNTKYMLSKNEKIPHRISALLSVLIQNEIEAANLLYENNVLGIANK